MPPRSHPIHGPQLMKLLVKKVLPSPLPKPPPTALRRVKLLLKPPRPMTTASNSEPRLLSPPELLLPPRTSARPGLRPPPLLSKKLESLRLMLLDHQRRPGKPGCMMAVLQLLLSSKLRPQVPLRSLPPLPPSPPLPPLPSETFGHEELLICMLVPNPTLMI